MAKYLIEETTTSVAAAGILGKPEDRGEALKPVFRAAGCELEHLYVSLNENKAYLIVESPELSNPYTVMGTIQASGAISSFKITPIVTISEAVDIFKKAASLNYRAPGK